MVNREELAETLRKHKLWLEGDMNGVRADLSKASLRKIDLRRVNLREADLWRVKMFRVDLRRADLRSADLRVASLRESDLRNADLREANLRWVDICETDLRGANLRGASLDYSAWPLRRWSFNVIADKRLVAQLLCHVARLNVSELPKNSKERLFVEGIRRRGIGDWFCEYQDNILPVKEVNDGN